MTARSPDSRLAPHVRAAIAAVAQPKITAASAGGRPAAAHVQLAIAAVAQPKAVAGSAGGRPVAAHVERTIAAIAQPQIAAASAGGRVVAAHVQRAMAAPVQAKLPGAVGGGKPVPAHVQRVVLPPLQPGHPGSAGGGRPRAAHIQRAIARPPSSRALPGVLQRTSQESDKTQSSRFARPTSRFARPTSTVKEPTTSFSTLLEFLTCFFQRGGAWEWFVSRDTDEEVVVSKPKIGRTGLVSIPVRWFFGEDLGGTVVGREEVRGVGFNLHLNRSHGEVFPGSAWAIGLEDQSCDSGDVPRLEKVCEMLQLQLAVKARVEEARMLLRLRELEEARKWESVRKKDTSDN